MLLVQISDQLSERDLKDLVFCCGSAIPEAKAERISSGVDLFKALKHQNYLAPGQYGYLRECLAAIGRVDLANKLPSELESVLRRVSQHEKPLTLRKKLAEGPLTNSNTLCPVSPMNHHAFSSRTLLLQVAADLTTEDTSKLAYLFADWLPCDVEKTDAFKLLLQLEAVGALHPDRPEMLTSVLNTIGRKDLATRVLSMQTPQPINPSLGTSHQLLHMKISMLTGKQSFYSNQRRLLSTIAKSSKAEFEEKIVNPVFQSLVGSYTYSTIHRLCAGTFDGIQQPGKFDELLRSTLSIVFEFTESYLNSIYHYVSCDGGNIRIHTVQPLLSTCQKSYGKFEEEISHFQWNTVLRGNVRSDLSQRRTPIGSPALTALSCIYELCSELSSESNVMKQAVGGAESSICALDYLHHSYCCGVVLTQWLESVLCLLTCSSDDPQFSISYDPQVLRATLLRIATEHQVQISSAYRKVEDVIGSGVLRRISERLHEDEVYIDHHDGAATLRHARLGGCESSMYVLNVGTTAYANLLLLLQFSYFGTKDLNLGVVFSRLKKFNFSFFSGSLFLSGSMRLYKNLVSAYEKQIERFVERALKSDPLCAPALRRFISV